MGQDEKDQNFVRAGSDHRLEILCVDDDADVRTIVALSLKLDPNISVHVAGDGAEALRMLSDGRYRPDCILLDMKLPGGDGKLLMGEIRCLEGHDLTPIIFLTADVTESQRFTVETLGAAGLIAKPFDPVDLAATVRTILDDL